MGHGQAATVYEHDDRGSSQHCNSRPPKRDRLGHVYRSAGDKRQAVATPVAHSPAKVGMKLDHTDVGDQCAFLQSTKLQRRCAKPDHGSYKSQCLKHQKSKSPRLTNQISAPQRAPAGVVERYWPHPSFEHRVDFELELRRDCRVVECPDSHRHGATRVDRRLVTS